MHPAKSGQSAQPINKALVPHLLRKGKVSLSSFRRSSLTKVSRLKFARLPWAKSRKCWPFWSTVIVFGVRIEEHRLWPSGSCRFCLDPSCGCSVPCWESVCLLEAPLLLLPLCQPFPKGICHQEGTVSIWPEPSFWYSALLWLPSVRLHSQCPFLNYKWGWHNLAYSTAVEMKWDVLNALCEPAVWAPPSRPRWAHASWHLVYLLSSEQQQCGKAA